MKKTNDGLRPKRVKTATKLAAVLSTSTSIVQILNFHQTPFFKNKKLHELRGAKVVNPFFNLNKYFPLQQNRLLGRSDTLSHPATL